MPPISIVTDSAAIFSDALYEGHELVSCVNLRIQVGDEWLNDTTDGRICRRLAELSVGGLARLHPPMVEDYVQIFSELSTRSNAVICILSSENLCGGLAAARQAAEVVKGPASIQVIDSLTTGPGLGFIIQEAARAARSERNDAQLGRFVRGLLPHVYTAFLFPSLRPLALHERLDIAQAVAAEMLGLLPFYVLEGGKLSPQRKARTMRQAQDYLHEFAEEFERLAYLGLIQGIHSHEQEIRNLHNRLSQLFPSIGLKEYGLSASLIALFGARCVGVAAMEKFTPGI